MQPHPCFGDDAENALTADRETIGARPCATAGQPARLVGAGRRHHANGLDEIVDVRVVGCKVTAGTGGDPTPKGRELETLRKMAERHTVRFELRFQYRPERSTLNSGSLGNSIDFEDLVQARQIYAHHAVRLFRRFHAANDRRSAPERNHHMTGGGANVEQLDDLLLVDRVSDDVRRVVERPVELSHAIPEAVPVTVRRSFVRVRRTDWQKRCRGSDSRRTQFQFFNSRRMLRFQRKSESS